MLAIFTWVSENATADSETQRSEGRGISLAFALMQRKGITDYQSVPDYIFGDADLLGHTIHSDYAQALWSSLRRCAEFRNWEITGRWFHFSQALYRKLASLASEE